MTDLIGAARAVAEARATRWGYDKTLDVDELEKWLFVMTTDPNLIDDLKAAQEAIQEAVASELEEFAAQRRTMADKYASQLTTCTNQVNNNIIEAYRQAANVARVGADYRNSNCKNCRDTRGGAPEHLTEQCTWNPPAGMFEEHDGCIGQDLVQVGWLSPMGTLSGRMDVVPAPGWKPVYVWKGQS